MPLALPHNGKPDLLRYSLLSSLPCAPKLTVYSKSSVLHQLWPKLQEIDMSMAGLIRRMLSIGSFIQPIVTPVLTCLNRATDAKSEDEEEVIRGSGYPSDPKTQAYLKKSIDPVFGYKGIVRFSWATIKVLLDKQGVESKWSACPSRDRLLITTLTFIYRIDDTTQRSTANWFSAGTDNERPKVWRDLGVSSVGEL